MLKNYEIIKSNFLNKEKNLSSYATKSSEGKRLNFEKEDFRPSFYHDIDRIINYNSYTRYLNKTQVFSFNENDNIQTRIVHVSLVSKIARTIGRSLNLNEDLIEAIALGHDIGHPPIGHLGEKILNKISVWELNESFKHNIESVRNYMFLENNGKGANLTVQVLDGIMCHNGEVLESIYKPKEKSIEEFLKEYHEAYKDLDNKQVLIPMTLEGCVVRISDIISYVGRDIEDAHKLNFIKREDIPLSITNILGNNHRDIVNTLIMDVINNSSECGYIKFSDNVFKALKELIEFNYKHIYLKANSKERIAYYELVFNTLFSHYLKDIENNNLDSEINKQFLSKMSSKYQEETSNKRKVVDFIAGMTDEYLIKCYNLIKD